MKRKSLGLLAIAVLAALAMTITGCSSESSNARKALNEQIEAIPSSYAASIQDLAASDSFSPLGSVGADPAAFIEKLITASNIDIKNVEASEDSATATVTVTHPDCNEIVNLMAQKAAEFKASDSYLDFGKEERFARAEEMLNEALSAGNSVESTVEIQLEKTESGWTVDDGLVEKIVAAIITSEQAQNLAAAMEPFGWRFDDMNASQIAETLKASGLPVGDIQAFDETSDPNGLLGRPNEYTSKAHFLDTRVHDEYGRDWVNGHINTDYGGTIEVFENTADAQKRANYLQSLYDNGLSFGKMYLYRKGTVVLRVGYELTPSQASEYEAAFYQR